MEGATALAAGLLGNKHLSRLSLRQNRIESAGADALVGVTLDPQTQPLNPKLSTSKSKPLTLQPKPSTLNPQPSTLHPGP